MRKNGRYELCERSGCFRLVYKTPSKKAHGKRFCSISCRTILQKGRKLTAKHRARIKASSARGKMSHRWVGSKIGYDGLHDWVNRVLGVPKICTFCGKKNVPGIDGRRTTQWANKSQHYYRDVNDWISLCIPCHKGYDKNKKKIMPKRSSNG